MFTALISLVLAIIILVIAGFVMLLADTTVGTVIIVAAIIYVYIRWRGKKAEQTNDN